MNTDLLLSIVFRWMHILAAVVAIGGTIFMRFVLVPAVKESLTPEQHAALRERLIGRWKLVVMTCITALLISGAYNFIYTSLPKGKVHALYHPLFGVKFLAALAVFFIASALTGRDNAFARMRQNAAFWLAATATLGILVILLSGVLGKLTL